MMFQECHGQMTSNEKQDLDAVKCVFHLWVIASLLGLTIEDLRCK